MINNFFIGVFSLNLLFACATDKIDSASTQNQPVRAEVPLSLRPDASTISLTALSDGNLPRGKCGMVLWTLDASRPVPVLRYVAGNVGEVHLNNTPYELIRVNVGGNAVFGVFPVQSFAAGKDITVAVEVQFGQGFDGGTYLERGTISIEKPDSPTLITPVAGIAGCRAK